MTQALLPTSIRPPNGEELFPFQEGGETLWLTREEILAAAMRAQGFDDLAARAHRSWMAQQQAQADMAAMGMASALAGSLFGRRWGRF